MSQKISNIKLLKKHGLKPTSQRVFLSKILFSGQDMHFCADDLKKLILKKGYKMSLATIYNNLQHFANAGLLQRRKVSSSKIFFDNNISNHYHFYDEEKQLLIDIPTSSIKFSNFPKLPENKKITGVDLIININKK
tara:strand:+ start:1087 stop:1494 length:408 start_codon:yes stop_codon:yes gene_type:complete